MVQSQVLRAVISRTETTYAATVSLLPVLNDKPDGYMMIPSFPAPHPHRSAVPHGAQRRPYSQMEYWI